MTILVVENTLYQSDADRQQWVNDPQAVSDAFMFNFIGILGLYKISSKRGRMKSYPKENTNVRINAIDADDNDMANVIKLMNEIGALPNDTANQMTRLLAKLRQGNVDIQDQPIRDLIANVKVSKAKPSPKLRVIYNAFTEGNITLEQVAKAIQPFVRQAEFKVRSGEFKELAKSYRPILKNDIPEPNFTAAASAATATTGPQQQATQQKTDDAKDVKPSQSPEAQKQDFSKASEPMQFFTTTKNMYRKQIRDYAKSVGLAKVSDIEAIVQNKLKFEFRDMTNTKIYPLPAEWADKLGSFQDKPQLRSSLENSIKHQMLSGAKPDDTIVLEFVVAMPSNDKEKDIRFNATDMEFFTKNVQTIDDLKNTAVWATMLRNRNFVLMRRSEFEDHGADIMMKNPYYFLKTSKELFDSGDPNARGMMGVLHQLGAGKTRGLTQTLNKIVENGEFDESSQSIKLPLLIYQEVTQSLRNVQNSFDTSPIMDRLQQQKIEGNTLYQFAQSSGGASNPLTYNYSFADATQSLMGRNIRENIEGTRKVLTLARETDPNISLHLSDLAHANGVDPDNPDKDEDTAKFFIKTLGFFFLFEREETVPAHINDELTQFADKIDFTNTGRNLVFAMIKRFRVALMTSIVYNPILFMDETKFEQMLMDAVDNTDTNTLSINFFGMSSRYDIDQFLENFFRNLNDGDRIAQDFFDKMQNTNPEMMAMMYGHENRRRVSSGDVVGFNVNAIPRDKKIEYTKTAVRHTIEKLDTTGMTDRNPKFKTLLKYDVEGARGFNAFQEIILPLVKEMFGEEELESMLKTPNEMQTFRSNKIDAMIAGVIEKRGNTGAKEIINAWKENLNTEDTFHPTSGEYILKAVIKNLESPSREDYETIVEYIDAVGEKTKGVYRDYKKQMMRAVPPETFVQTERTEELVDLANEDIYAAGTRERFDMETKNFLIELSHSLGSLDKESARKVMNQMAQTSTASRKRDFRSDAINVLGKMFFSARESGYLDVLDEAHDNIKGKNKEHVENRMLSGMVVSKIKPAIMGDDTPIKPQQDLDDDGIMKLLDYNNINVKEVMGNVDLKRKKLSEKVHAVENTSSVDFQQLAIEEDDEIEDIERWSAEYYTLYQAKAHGRIAADFKRAFKVNIQKQVDGVAEFKKKYPNSEIVEPSFHGTGSVAASMILRFGFATVSERDSGPIQVTGKMMGEGIYVTDKIDKALQYVGDSGFSRGLGTTGYVLECETVLGENGVTYQGAGGGGDNIRSPEWAVRLPNQQVRIKRAYEVEIIDESTMQDRVKSYGLVNEDRSLNTSNFKYFLTEAKKRKKGMITHIFYDGLIPLPNGDVAEIDELDRSKLKDNVIFEKSAKGPLIAYPGDDALYHVDSTADFIQRSKYFNAFKKNVFK